MTFDVWGDLRGNEDAIKRDPRSPTATAIREQFEATR